MKKLLLGSTALVAGGLMAAPAMAADPIKIGLGGYYQFFVNGGGIEGVYALNGNSIQYKGLSFYQEGDRKSTRLNSSHRSLSRMPSSA